MKNIALIQSNHLLLQWKFKLSVEHCWAFWNKKFVHMTQQYFALLPQVNFPANNLNFHWRRRWRDQIQAIFLNIFYFNHKKDCFLWSKNIWWFQDLHAKYFKALMKFLFVWFLLKNLISIYFSNFLGKLSRQYTANYPLCKVFLVRRIFFLVILEQEGYFAAAASVHIRVSRHGFCYI